MKSKIILTIALAFLAFNFAQAQGNWEIANQTVIPNATSVSSSATITAQGEFEWTSTKAFLNDKHLARLNFALPTGVVVSSGTPSVSVDNTPVQGAVFNMNTGGWTCEFAPGTVFAPGTKLVFRVANLEIKDDQAYVHQQLTSFISFVASPAAENFTDNAATESFNSNVNGPLPINLLNFNANLVEINKTSAKVKLDWETVTEKNSSHFMIQRSANSSDWEDIKRVEAKGNSTTNVSYEDFDLNPLTGTSYYRLKQFDQNNEFNLSEVRTVYWNRDNGLISLYPNPTSDILNVEFSLEEKALIEVKVLTAEGRVAKGIIKWSEKGLNKVELDINELANGVYNVNVYKNNNLMSVGKVQKN